MGPIRFIIQKIYLMNGWTSLKSPTFLNNMGFLYLTNSTSHIPSILSTTIKRTDSKEPANIAGSLQ